MKKSFLTVVTLALLALAIPTNSVAQCPSNADNISCFDLPNGQCVTYPGGKLRFWITSQLISQAKPMMDNEFPQYSYGDYFRSYYRTGQMSITYLGGTWANGQSFRVEMGDCTIIVVTDGGF